MHLCSWLILNAARTAEASLGAHTMLPDATLQAVAALVLLFLQTPWVTIATLLA